MRLATIELLKFVTPWLLYRIIWLPTTRKMFRSLRADHHLTACEASSRLANFNLVLGCVVLLMALVYNGQLPLLDCFAWIREKVVCR